MEAAMEAAMQDGKGDGADRGKRASFDRRTGEVSGSGAGAGNNPDAREEYDSDLHEEVPVGTKEEDDL
jgi:hypothetical protein